MLDRVNVGIACGRARVITRRFFSGWGQPRSRVGNTNIICGHDNKTFKTDASIAREPPDARHAIGYRDIPIDALDVYLSPPPLPVEPDQV